MLHLLNLCHIVQQVFGKNVSGNRILGSEMRKQMTALVVLFVCSGVASATDLITQPEAAFYLQPPQFDGQLQTIIGDRSVLNPSWSIIQQGAPIPIPAGTGQNYLFSPGTSWKLTQESSLRIQFNAYPVRESPENTVEFSQDSRKLSCKAGEWILLAQSIPAGPPFGSGYRSPSGAQIASRNSQSAPLDSIHHVKVQLGLVIPSETIDHTCDINASGYQVGLGVRNVSKGLFMFYYIGFRDSREPPASDLATCGGYPTDNLYCYTTSARALSGSGPANQAVSATRTYYDLDAYNDIIAAIAKTSDPNPADWIVDSGSTFGSGVVGHVVNVSDWDSLKISAF